MSFRPRPIFSCAASPWLFLLAWLGLLLQPLPPSIDDAARGVAAAQRATATHTRLAQAASMTAPATFDERHLGLAAFDAFALPRAAAAPPSAPRGADACAALQTRALPLAGGYAAQARAPPRLA
jgi:hypothetical protein